MNEGWICPRCSKVNAPDVKECGCKNDEELKKISNNLNPNYHQVYERRTV